MNVCLSCVHVIDTLFSSQSYGLTHYFIDVMYLDGQKVF